MHSTHTESEPKQMCIRDSVSNTPITIPYLIPKCAFPFGHQLMHCWHAMHSPPVTCSFFVKSIPMLHFAVHKEQALHSRPGFSIFKNAPLEISAYTCLLYTSGLDLPLWERSAGCPRKAALRQDDRKFLFQSFFQYGRKMASCL